MSSNYYITEPKFVLYSKIEEFANHGSGIFAYSYIPYLVNNLSNGSNGLFILPIFASVTWVYISVVLELEGPKIS